jgi:WNK lysine deficient protein kinase
MFMINFILNNLQFDQEIGFGTYKRVFRGFDFNEGREVAWNSINVSEMEDSELDRIRDEINIMKKLNHPNIINYISGWFDKQRREVVIITEIICGGSLKKHLTKILNPRLKLIKFWIKEILRGLKYLHNEVNPPIVHRDIKCDNLYIDSTNGRIKIGDLGLSKIQSSNCTSSFAGTEEFMAPEVFQGKYSVLADVYSLGMCVLEMLTGEKPYKEYESNILKIYECVRKLLLKKLKTFSFYVLT